MKMKTLSTIYLYFRKKMMLSNIRTNIFQRLFINCHHCQVRAVRDLSSAPCSQSAGWSFLLQLSHKNPISCGSGGELHYIVYI